MKVLLIGIAVLLVTTMPCDGGPEDGVEYYFECFERHYLNGSEDDFTIYCEGFEVEHDYEDSAAVDEVS